MRENLDTRRRAALGDPMIEDPWRVHGGTGNTKRILAAAHSRHLRGCRHPLLFQLPGASHHHHRLQYATTTTEKVIPPAAPAKSAQPTSNATSNAASVAISIVAEGQRPRPPATAGALFNSPALLFQRIEDLRARPPGRFQSRFFLSFLDRNDGERAYPPIRFSLNSRVQSAAPGDACARLASARDRRSATRS